GFNWTFNFTKHGRLVARLNRLSDNATAKEEAGAHANSGGPSPPFSPAAKQDVQFIIGEPHNGRSEYGTPTKRQLVTQEAFQAWTRAALFLENPIPDELVQTSSGDLLIGQRFRRRLYLKGLFLSEDTASRLASVTNKPLRYGYNFSAGTTNRERQSVAGAYEESATILDIWVKAVAKRPELVGALSDLLNSRQVEYADVAGAARNIGKRTAQMLMAYLRHDKADEVYHGRWLLSPKEKLDCPRLESILHGLGCEAFELSQPYWDLLRSHKLVHSAEEEERRRFKLASAATPSGEFAFKVSVVLQAAVRACQLTRHTELRFVKGGDLQLQTL
ncbi:hypothetical protein K4F52_010389, partial [Lecanicillium sp. MT-2017a]